MTASRRPLRPLGFIAHVNVVFLSSVAAAALAFGVSVLLARALSLHDRGVYGVFMVSASITQAILGLGLTVSAVYYLSASKLSASRVMANGLQVTAASATLTAVGVAVAWPFIGDNVGDAGAPFWMFIIIVPLFLAYNMFLATFQGSSRFLAMNLLVVVVPLTQLLLLAAGGLLGDVNTTAAVLFWAGATLTAVLLATALARPILDFGHLLRIDTQSFREQAAFGLRGQVGNLMQLLNYRLDQYLVLALVSAAGVGIYAVAVQLSQSIWFLSNAIATVLIPRLAASEQSEAARVTPLLCRNTLLVSALGALAIAIPSLWMLPIIFGDAYSDALVPLLWLLPGAVLLSGSKILTGYIFSQGRPGTNSMITIGSLAVTLAADLLLIPFFEVTGAAIASTLAYGTHFVLALLAYRRISGESIAGALFIRGEDLRRYVSLAGSVRL